MYMDIWINPMCWSVLDCRHVHNNVFYEYAANMKVAPLPWASVHWLVQCTLECHWNATGWLTVHCDTTGRPNEYLQHTPLEKLRWNLPTLEYHWRNSDFCSLHWNITGGNTQVHIVLQSSIHASLKLQDGGTPSSKWIGLCKFSFYFEFTALLVCIASPPIIVIEPNSPSNAFVSIQCHCTWMVMNRTCG